MAAAVAASAATAAAALPWVFNLFGPGAAAHLRALAHGEDDRPVVSGRAAKSISEERTYGADLTDPSALPGPGQSMGQLMAHR